MPQDEASHTALSGLVLLDSFWRGSVSPVLVPQDRQLLSCTPGCKDYAHCRNHYLCSSEGSACPAPLGTKRNPGMLYVEGFVTLIIKIAPVVRSIWMTFLAHALYHSDTPEVEQVWWPNQTYSSCSLQATCGPAHVRMTVSYHSVKGWTPLDREADT